VQIPKGNGQSLGFQREKAFNSKALAIFTAAVAVAFAATGIKKSPITSCNRQDHAVCQASANIRKIYGRRRCGLLAAKGIVGLHSAGKCDIYDCLVQFKFGATMNFTGNKIAGINIRPTVEHTAPEQMDSYSRRKRNVILYLYLFYTYRDSMMRAAADTHEVRLTRRYRYRRTKQ